MRLVQSVLGPFAVWDADHLGQQLEAGTWWDAHLRPFLDSADPSGWAIDIGANVGWFTRYLLQRHAGVIAVEAHIDTFQLLVQNVPPGERAILLHGVAYDRPAWFDRAPNALLGWSADSMAQCPNASSVAFVRCHTPAYPAVPGVVVDHTVGDLRVSLIKVDAQGCDLRALRGLRQTIRRDRPLIVFEFEEAAASWHGDDWDDYEQFFAREGYGVERVREDLWDFVARPR